MFALKGKLPSPQNSDFLRVNRNKMLHFTHFIWRKLGCEMLLWPCENNIKWTSQFKHTPLTRILVVLTLIQSKIVKITLEACSLSRSDWILLTDFVKIHWIPRKIYNTDLVITYAKQPVETDSMQIFLSFGGCNQEAGIKGAVRLTERPRSFGKIEWRLFAMKQLSCVEKNKRWMWCGRLFFLSFFFRFKSSVEIDQWPLYLT